MDFLKENKIKLMNSWFFFFVFFMANYFLSYESLSYTAKGWIVVLGLILPGLILTVLNTKEQNIDLLYTENGKAYSSKWFLLSVALPGVFLRFFHLTNFYLWPTGDEALHGFLAIPLSVQWNWQFFYTVGEHPPLLIWSLVPFFKYFDSPFFNIWFLPAFFSSIAFLAGYWASRELFSKSFSWLFSFLLGFSFWPLYFGRFCHQGLFIPFWEMFGFGLLAVFLKSQKESRKITLAFALGLWIGLGSLTFTAWAVVILLFSLIVTFKGWYGRQSALVYPLSYGIGLLLGLCPFIIAAVHTGYGNHLIDTSAASHYFSTAHQWITHLSYLTCLFWGPIEQGASYGPVWGGILNPILSSCFFMGAIELVRRRKEKTTFWIFAAFFILLLPGLLSSDYVEFNRVIQVMPILLLITALGIQRLVSDLPNEKKWVLIALLFCSFLFDINHLLKPAVDGPVWRLDFKKESTDENYRAYQIFESEYFENGPGLIYSDFVPLTHGHTVHVMTYHFNAALNPNFKEVQPKWAGLMVNVHYQSFLEKRFPGSVWKNVSIATEGQGGSVVGIIPINSTNHATFTRWNQVHQYFYQQNLLAENMYNDPKLYRSVLEHFSEGYPLMKGDPFLESCFGEWVTQFHWGADHQQNILLMKRALQNGYPSAHLYFKLGEYLFLDNRLPEAKTAFELAVSCHPNQTEAGDWLQTTNQMMAKNKGK